MPFHRKRVKAVDPHCLDRHRVEAHKARFLPKKFNLPVRDDDEDVESFTPHSNQPKVRPREQSSGELRREAKKKRKQREAELRPPEELALDDDDDDNDGAPNKRQKHGDFSAKSLQMPTLLPGESMRNFKRRLNKAKTAAFANPIVTEASRPTAEVSHMSAKRKQLRVCLLAVALSSS